MDGAFFIAYRSINLFFGLEALVFGVLFLVMALPRSPVLKNYRTCRIMLTLLCFLLAALSIADCLGGGGSFGNGADLWRARCDTLISSSASTIFLSLALVTVVNADYFSLKRLGLELLPFLLFSSALMASTLLGWPKAVLSIIYWAFVALYAFQLARAFRLVAAEELWARRRMDDYSAGRGQESLTKLERGGWIACAWGVATLVFLIAPGWPFAVAMVALSVLAFLSICVIYFNYPLMFLSLEPILKPGEGGQKSQAYQQSRLSNIDIDAKLRELSATMAHRKPYTDTELNIEELGALIGLSPHQLSELLNARLGQNFRAYINAARVEEAKRLLRESPGSSILDDALESGFNSKASFNRVFRETTGLSPREWRKQAPHEGI